MWLVTHSISPFSAQACVFACVCVCMSGYACALCFVIVIALSWMLLMMWRRERKKGFICENPICSVYSFATFYDLYIISCFLFAFTWQTSQVVFRSDSELYESFGKWNPMVAFLMWLPNGNFHIVYMLIRIILSYTPKRYAHIDNIYFIHMCMCVWVYAPIQCTVYMNDSEDLINEHTHTHTQYTFLYTKHLSYLKRVELWKLSKYLFNIYSILAIR